VIHEALVTNTSVVQHQFQVPDWGGTMRKEQAYWLSLKDSSRASNHVLKGYHQKHLFHGILHSLFHLK
jgi:hypothetical protein